LRFWIVRWLNSPSQRKFTVEVSIFARLNKYVALALVSNGCTANCADRAVLDNVFYGNRTPDSRKP
jgi:hypothetical protein